MSEEEKIPLEKKVRSKLTNYEWKTLKERMRLNDKMSSFQREYRKQMRTFIIGAFSFVAALFWRDAIRSGIDMIISMVSIPIQQEVVINFITALLVSGIAIVAIILISKTTKSS